MELLNAFIFLIGITSAIAVNSILLVVLSEVKIIRFLAEKHTRLCFMFMLLASLGTIKALHKIFIWAWS